jgi:hypothetical protein
VSVAGIWCAEKGVEGGAGVGAGRSVGGRERGPNKAAWPPGGCVELMYCRSRPTSVIEGSLANGKMSTANGTSTTSHGPCPTLAAGHSTERRHRWNGIGIRPNVTTNEQRWHAKNSNTH